MMENNNTEFANGFMFKQPHQNAPQFVKGRISIKLDEALNLLQNEMRNGNQWLNLDIKESKNGKYYIAIDRWQPNSNVQQQGFNQQQQPPQQHGQPTQYQQQPNQQPDPFAGFGGGNPNDPF